MPDLLDFLMPRRAAIGASTPSGGGWFGVNRTRTSSNVIVDEEIALTYSMVFLCTRILCEPAASLPLLLYERESNGDRRIISTPASEVVSLAPNPSMTAMPFREGRTMHMVNWGNGFAEIQRDPRTQEPVALWPIHPSRVRPAQAGSGYDYAVRNNDGTNTGMMADELLHLCGTLSDDGIWGRGIIQHARESIGFGLGTERHGAAYFGSGAQPKGVVITPGLKQREDRRAFRAEWKEIHASPESSEIAILPKDSDYRPITLSNQDNQFLETRGFNRIEVAHWYRVPIYLVQDSAPRGNMESLGAEFVSFSLFPWIRRWEEQLQLKLIPPSQRGRYYWEHNFLSLLRGDIAARMNAYRVAMMTGIMTINEIRRLENMNGIGSAGDQSYVPANLVTAHEMAAQGSQGIRPPGSDHTGAPADNPLDHEPVAFDRWRRTLPKLQGDELQQQVREMERRLEHRPVEYMEAARAVLGDALRRLFTKEAGAAGRAAKPGADFDRHLREFYAQHETLAGEALKPACMTLKLAGVKKWERPEDLAAWLRARSTEQLRASYDRDSPETFNRKLAAWPGERVQAVVEEVLAA